MSWQLGAFVVLGLALAAGFAWYERERPDARIVALVGTLAAFAALGRIAFAALPNVKPTTDIVLISGYALGGGPGFAVGALAGLTSNFFFGQGPWTPWQMAAWGATGLFGAALAWTVTVARRRRLGMGGVRDPAPIGRWPLALACLVAGFGFTVVQDVGDWVNYSDHSWAQLGVYVGKGLGFDAIHAAGCLAFALAFGPALNRSVSRFARRLQVTWVQPGVAAPMAAVLVALALVPGAALPGTARAAVSPVSYLRGAENADGGFGAAPGQPSAALYTGWAALGLASAGQDLQRVAHGAHGLLAYLAASPGSTSDVGSLERTVLVVRAAGLPASHFGGRDLVAALRSHIRGNGSVSGQVNLTAFAVLALRAAGTAPPARTYGWLERQQDRDGGFSFAGAGGSSDIDDTGAVLEALGRSRAASVRSHAVGYLRRHQNRDGGFPQQPGASSNAQSTAWAIQGLEADGVAPRSLHRGGAQSPLAYLRSLAAPDGHIRYARAANQTPVWVTGEALMALEGKPLPLAPVVSAAPRATAPASPAKSSSQATHPASGAGPATSASATTSTASAPSPRKRSIAAGARAAADHAARSQGMAAAATLASAAGFATALVLAPLDLG
jgi:Prenyltransferase and squalene oxidase repeat